MNILWTLAGTWMLHTAIGGGILLLVTCVLMRWTRQPVRRQRLGDWGMTAALAVALCSGLAPSWLVIAWTRSEPATASGGADEQGVARPVFDYGGCAGK